MEWENVFKLIQKGDASGMTEHKKGSDRSQSAHSARYICQVFKLTSNQEDQLLT